MKIAVIGVGNILFMDEGVGVYASKMLKENYVFKPEIEIVDGGTLGFKLMDYFEDYDKVVILDTVSIDDNPGSVYNLPAEALMGLGDYRKTVHEVEVVGMLEICSMLDKMAEVSVMGIIPEDILTVQINLTETVKQGLPLLLEKSVNILRAAGIDVTPKPMQQTIETILSFYDDPGMRLR
ncbi:HyaD/HybD family hydrogenase maturation endopeptidase [Sulfurimonas sp. HSL3-7]|uniref:HyaD/HybD family hydrogenase maturation endopeptidase n=1 Tax=Sulfonitrofixus jiaomeiensis TaxID=3131938 RepID=UPI0031F91241